MFDVFDIINIVLIILLVFLLVEPKVLRFMKRPTRLKAFALWLVLLIITSQIYIRTPEYEKEQTKIAQENLEQYNNSNGRPRKNKTKKYPIWDVYRLNPIKDKDDK